MKIGFFIFNKKDFKYQIASLLNNEDTLSYLNLKVKFKGSFSTSHFDTFIILH